MMLNYLSGTLKYVLLFSLALLGMASATAQSNPHEIGLRLSGLEDFDFVYKKQVDTSKFNRHRLAFANMSFRRQPGIENFDFFVSYAIGREKRKPISDKLYFIHGFEPILRFSISTSSNRAPQYRLEPGAGYVLGFHYAFSESFYINLETVPGINFDFRITNGEFNDNYGINAGFSSNAVAITLAYCFTTEQKD